MSRPSKAGHDHTASIDEIDEFLQQIKAEVRKPGRFHFIHRKGNLNSLAKLGITIDIAKDEILSLTYQHYDRGPLDDHSGDGVIWEFIKKIDGDQVYIKLKHDSNRGCVCISFHGSSSPCRLPYR